MTNLYVDRSTFKDRLGITGTGDDEEVLLLLEHLSRAIDEYCGRTFFVETATRYLDGTGSRLLLDRDLVSVTTLKTDDDNDGTYESTWASTDYFLLPLNGSPKWAVEVDRRTAGTKSVLAAGIQKGVEIAGKWGYQESTVSSGATAAEDIDTTETAIDVSDGTKFLVGQTVQVDSEQLYVSAISGNTLTVTRAVNGTTAATHSNGAAISRHQYPRPVSEALIVLAGQAWQRRKLALEGSQAPAGPLGGLAPEARSLLGPFRLVVLAAV